MLVERMQHFVIPVSAADVQPKLGLSLQVDLDASFRLYGVCVWNLGVPEVDGVDGQVAVRLYRPNAQQIQRQLTASNLLFPGNQYNLTGVSPNKAMAAPIRPGVLFPAGSVINLRCDVGLGTGIAVPAGVLVILLGNEHLAQGGQRLQPAVSGSSTWESAALTSIILHGAIDRAHWPANEKITLSPLRRTPISFGRPVCTRIRPRRT